MPGGSMAPPVVAVPAAASVPVETGTPPDGTPPPVPWDGGVGLPWDGGGGGSLTSRTRRAGAGPTVSAVAG